MGMDVGAKIASSVHESQLWQPLSRDPSKPLHPSRSPFPRPEMRSIVAPVQGLCQSRRDSPVEHTAQCRAQCKCSSPNSGNVCRSRCCHCPRSSITTGAPRGPAQSKSPEQGLRNPCVERVSPGDSKYTPDEADPAPHFTDRKPWPRQPGGLTPGYTQADVWPQTPDPQSQTGDSVPEGGVCVCSFTGLTGPRWGAAR